METRLTCPDCHTRLDEWRNEEGKLIEAYRATDHHCPGCEAIEAHHKHISFQARETGFDMHGIRTKLVEGSREPMRPT